LSVGLLFVVKNLIPQLVKDLESAIGVGWLLLASAFTRAASSAEVTVAHQSRPSRTVPLTVPGTVARTVPIT